MISVIDSYLAKGREEGFAQGRAEGQAEGLAQGRAEGLAEARKEYEASLAEKDRAMREMEQELRELRVRCGQA